MPRFDLQRFLGDTGVSVTRLASYLRVAPSYLEAAAAGQGRLTRRDQDACRLLWRRLTQAVQLSLPFAEPLEAFTREHAHRVARAASKTRTGGASAASLRRSRRELALT